MTAAPEGPKPFVVRRFTEDSPVHFSAGRIYSVRVAHALAIIEGLTLPEAEAIAKALIAPEEEEALQFLVIES